MEFLSHQCDLMIGVFLFFFCFCRYEFDGGSNRLCMVVDEQNEG